MGLRTDPVGRGQFQQMVQQLMEIERQPIRQLEGRKIKEEAKHKLLQELRSRFSALEQALKGMASPRKFRELKVDLGAGKELISVTVDKDRAEPGQYQLEVTELATSTRALSNGISHPEEVFLGTGLIVLENNQGETVEIQIPEAQSNLKSIERAINREADSPIQASIIQDQEDPEAPWKLLLCAKNQGEEKHIEFPAFYFSGGEEDFWIEQEESSENGTLQLNGFEIQCAENQISDFLPGINLNLLQAKEDFPFTLSITADFEKMGGKVQELIEKINPILQFIIQQNTLDERTDTSTTFGGDGSLQLIEYRIRNLVHRPYLAEDPKTQESQTIFLNQIGIEFEKSGLLTFKKEKFQKALEDQPELMIQAVAGMEGFFGTLSQSIQTDTRLFQGTLALKDQGIQSRIDSIDQQIEQKNRFLEQKKQQLTQQFSRLESTVASLQQQQQSLGAILPGMGAGGGLLQLIGG